MIWEYNISTNTIWTSFDYGEVEADTREEAIAKATEELNYNFEKANTALAHCDVTNGFIIEFDIKQLEINIKEQ